MADNVIADPGAGGSTFATDDIGGVHYPRTKVTWGADGAATDVADSGGARLPVKVGDALPAGTNNIGDMDVLSLPGSITGKAEDAAAASGDVGVPILGVRNDAGAASTSLDGDYAMVAMDSAGRVGVCDLGGTVSVDDGGSTVSIDDGAGSITVDGAVTVSGTATVSQGTAANLKAEVQGPAAHDAVAAGSPVLVAGFASAAAPADVTADGDAVNAWRLRNGSAAVTITAAGALIGGDAANGLDVDVTRLPALPTGGNKIGVVDLDSDAATGAAVPSVAQFVAGTDGTNARGLKTDASGELQVDVLTLPNVTLAAGTNTNEVVGDAAHDAAVAGNPVLVGHEARTSDGTPVTSGDAVRSLADTLGKQVVLLGAVHDLQVNGKGTFSNTTAADLIAAAGAGVKIAVMSVLVTNAHATTATKVEIRDGTTVKIQGQAAAAGGGFSMNGGGHPLFISTANTAVTGRAVTTGADVDIFVSGYKLAN